MPGLYTLTAIPELLTEGEDKSLEYVTFIAEEGNTRHKWWSTNTGTYAEDFARIVPFDTARSILERLRGGETVLFPGFWSYEELRAHSFGGVANE